MIPSILMAIIVSLPAWSQTPPAAEENIFDTKDQVINESTASPISESSDEPSSEDNFEEESDITSDESFSDEDSYADEGFEEDDALSTEPIEPEEAVVVEPADLPPLVEQAVEDVQFSESKSVQSFDLNKVRSQNPNKTQKVPHPLAEKGLKRITKDNIYIYETKASPKEHASTFLISSFEPDTFDGNAEFPDASTTTYDEIYDDSIMVTVDYEWPLWSNFLGEIGLKITTGFMFANGKGVFERDGTESAEELTLVMFPNSVGAIWRLRWSVDQLFVPYAEGGAGYFGLIEFQNEANDFKFGGNAVGYAAGGLALNIGRLSKQALLDMDRDYGVNGILLNLEFRIVQGAAPFNLSYNTIGAGFTFEY